MYNEITSPIETHTDCSHAVYSNERAFADLRSEPTCEICLIETGSGIHQVLGQSIPCKAGDLYIIPSDIPHEFFLQESGQQLQVYTLRFDPERLFTGEAALRGHPRYCYGNFRDNSTVAYAMLNSQTRAQVDRILKEIDRELASKGDEWVHAVAALLQLLLITLGRYVSRAIQNIPNLSPKEWRLIIPAIREISAHFGESELTLQTIAEKLFVSKSHLSRLFKAVTGQSFTEYLRSLRLSHACHLLSRSEIPVDQIVMQCGLKDVPSFYHSFQEYTGMTPGQYRNKNKKGDKIMVILSEISENLQKGKAKIVKEMVEQAIAEGCSPADILNDGLLAGMNIIGEKFRDNQVYVPEVLVAARAMKMGTDVLKPYLIESGVEATGKVCIGTVQGDLHDIGKNLVKMMLEGKGLEVIDLGTDVAPEAFVQAAVEQNCQVICCSALLTTTMDAMAAVVKACEAAGIRDKVKIMVGGAPVTEEFCNQIGADCYTSDAASAANAAVELCK